MDYDGHNRLHLTYPKTDAALMEGHDACVPSMNMFDLSVLSTV